MRYFYLSVFLNIGLLGFAQNNNLNEAERIQLSKENINSSEVINYTIEYKNDKNNNFDQVILNQLLNGKDGILFYKVFAKGQKFDFYCTNEITFETIEEIFLMAGAYQEEITPIKIQNQ